MSKNYTLDNSSWASNPGNATIQPLTWFFHDKINILYLSSLLISSILLTVFTSGVFVVFLAYTVYKNIYYWLRKKEHFQSGDSNGGLIVSIKPTLVAVTTDLTKGFGQYPVVKIIKCSSIKNVNVGDKIATVALYTASNNNNLSHWIDFNPIPLSYATNNELDLKTALESYDDEEWNNLENRIKEIKKPYKTGLYKSKFPNSDW